MSKEDIPEDFPADAESRRWMKPEGHTMLLITKESCSMETMVNGNWITRNVTPRGALPKGVYDLTGARRPGESRITRSFRGTVLHVDEKHVYQLQAKGNDIRLKSDTVVSDVDAKDKGKAATIRHDLALYKEPPRIGSTTKVKYVGGTGQVVIRGQMSGKNMPAERKSEGHTMLLITKESCMLDTVVNGDLVTQKVTPRGGLPKGLYDLTGAERPGKNGATKSFEGTVLHVDEKHVYQIQANDKGKSDTVRHDRALYKEPPILGSTTKVDYVRGTGQVVSREQEQEH